MARTALCAVSISGGLMASTVPGYTTAGGTNRTCADLDTGQGGAAYTSNGNEQFNLTLADGNVLTSTGGRLIIWEPGSTVDQILDPSGTINVTAGNAGNWSVRRNTVATLSCQVSSSSSASESDNLDAQQDALSSLLMLHHANTMRMGVEENIDGALSGASQATGITPNGFAFSSRALAMQSGSDTAPLWNAWVRGRLSQYDGDGNSFDGHIADVFAGLDYQWSQSVVVGAMFGYGQTDFSTLISTVPGGFEADSLTVGAYAGIELLEALQLSTSASYTRSDYENRSGATAGSFFADRLTISANLSGQHRMQNGFILEPSLDFLWASERQDAYTDSAAVTHAANTINAGRISLGPRLISPDLLNGEGTLRLWSSAMAEYDFANQSPVPTSGLPDLSSLTSLRVSAGLNSHVGRGQLSLRGDVFGLGSGEFTAYGGSLAYQLPF
jgi:outer membrane autotransporter protein